MKTAGAKYLELIRKFPLQEISDEETLAMADQVAVELFSRATTLDEDENAYLDALTILIRAFEKVAHPSKFEKASVPDVLRYLMEEHQMSQAEFARVLDIPRTRVTEILSGVRELSKIQIATISERFKPNASLFLPNVKMIAAKSSGAKSSGV